MSIREIGLLSCSIISIYSPRCHLMLSLECCVLPLGPLGPLGFFTCYYWTFGLSLRSYFHISSWQNSHTPAQYVLLCCILNPRCFSWHTIWVDFYWGWFCLPSPSSWNELVSSIFGYLLHLLSCSASGYAFTGHQCLWHLCSSLWKPCL